MPADNNPDLASPAPYAAPAGTANLPMTPDSGVSNVARLTGMLITAQPVGVYRDEARARASIKAACAAHGDEFIYSWPVKDRRGGRTTHIEGPTIKLAMTIARYYGNNFVGVVDTIDMGDRWIMKALFIDQETGFCTSRDFLQRKGQSIGMSDRDREGDIVFQIGQSKAIRNVIVNALPDLCAFAEEEAKKNVLARVEGNIKGANEYIDNMMAQHNIELANVERVVGRPRSGWTVRDVARIFAEIRGIEDGMITAAELYAGTTETTETVEGKSTTVDGDKPPPARKRGRPKGSRAKPRTEPEKGGDADESSGVPKAGHVEKAEASVPTSDVAPEDPPAPTDESAADETSPPADEDEDEFGDDLDFK